MDDDKAIADYLKGRLDAGLKEMERYLEETPVTVVEADGTVHWEAPLGTRLEIPDIVDRPTYRGVQDGIAYWQVPPGTKFDGLERSDHGQA